MSSVQQMVSFAASNGASVTYNVPVPGQVVLLPPLDASNSALTISNTGSTPVAVMLGTSPTLPIVPDGSRGYVLRAGETRLFYVDPGQLALTATYAAVVPTGAGGATGITFTRGTVSPLSLFSNWN